MLNAKLAINKCSPTKFTSTISHTMSVCWSNLVCYLGVNVNTKLKLYWTLPNDCCQGNQNLEMSLAECLDDLVRLKVKHIKPSSNLFCMAYTCVIWFLHTTIDIFTLKPSSLMWLVQLVIAGGFAISSSWSIPSS